MTIDQFSHQINSLRRRHVRKANQSGMWNIMQVYQLSKIGVDCDQHPTIIFREFQQGPVSRVRAQIPGLDNVMSVDSKPLC